MDAIIDTFEAHQTMSSQALGSERVRDGLTDILLGPVQLYEALRARSTVAPRHGAGPGT
jgi:type I restriction enzyme R subunit